MLLREKASAEICGLLRVLRASSWENIESDAGLVLTKLLECQGTGQEFVGWFQETFGFPPKLIERYWNNYLHKETII